MTTSVTLAQTLLRIHLSLGDETPERELDMREHLFQALWLMFKAFQDPSHLYGAVDRLEIILRRLPSTSPKLPQYLNLLSNLRVSEFEITNAGAALDQAIELSLKAQSEAVSLGIPDSNKDLYLKILNGLGCAQSFRFYHLKRPKDLDDAVETGRKLVSMAPKESDFYLAGLSNLLSRLWTRFRTRHNSADADEAMNFLGQLILESPPDSTHHAAANRHRYTMAYEKFGDTGSLDDLGDAIRHAEAAKEQMVRNCTLEGRGEVLDHLGGMYGTRYEKQKDLEDLRMSLFYSEQRVHWTAPTHPSTGPSLWKYLLRARELGSQTSDIAEVETLIETANELMARMPKGDYTRRDVNQWLYGDLLTRRYTMTSNLDHLVAVVHNAEKMCMNEKSAGPRRQEVAVEKAVWLAGYLGKIAKAPDDNRVRRLASERLPGYFRTACETNGVPNASITLWNQQKHMVMVFAEAIEAGEDVEDEELDRRVADGVAKGKTAEEAAKGRLWWPWPEYTTEFGSRSLVGDPITKKSIVEIPAVAQKIFGYTDMSPLPRDQFIAQEIRLEKEALERETREGLHPNPHLCRGCRKLKVLEPCPDGGWKWNARTWLVPYGNYGQVFMRRACAVCSLLLSLIRHDGGLHPTLATIDREVQGFALEEVELDESKKVLSGGNQVLRVSYGLKEVGTLSILGSTIRSLHPELPLSQLKTTLRECDSDHGRQCNGQALTSQLSAPIDMLQIDVVDECLIRTTSAVKYFALSYIWGTVPMAETLKSNLASRLLKGALGAHGADPSSPLPQTIADAIALVKSLGERYLWVDALCIVQDDELTKQQNIQQMDKVYSQAFATIVVLSGSDAASGIPGVRPGSRPPLPSSTLSISDRSATLALDPSSAQVDPVTIVASPSQLSLAIASSTWNTRAWTCQERLLSSRCIYMAANAVYFHCRQGATHCETGKPESPAAPGLGILDNALHELQQIDTNLIDHRSGSAGDAVLRVVFGAYKGLVEGYSPRKLTFQGDVLNAFAGVFAALGKHMATGSGTVCGLPAAFLDLALLWTPVRVLTRREEEVVGADAFAAFTSSTDGRAKCPTWSWAGWVGPVEYRLFLEEEKRRPLPVSLVVDGFSLHRGGKVLEAACRRSVDDKDDGQHQPALSLRDADSDSDTLTDHGEHVLRFSAPVVSSLAFTRGTGLEHLCHKGENHSTGEQAVYRLYDRDGKHCGLCFQPMVPFDSSLPQFFVGIVKHWETGVPFKGPNRVEGDIPLFDLSVYRTSGPGTGVVDALLVVEDGEGIARRVSVARIHVKAWEGMGGEVRRVKLG